jgi:soluble lytic murein transglycosylase-like protein
VVKHFLVIVLLASLFIGRCFAGEATNGATNGTTNGATNDTTTDTMNNLRATPALNFEAQVREVAAKTAEEAKAKKEQERLEKAKASNRTISGEAFKVFKYKKDGTTTFSDSVPYKTKYEVIVYNSCYACSIVSSVNWYNTRLHLTEFSDTITNAAKQYGVDVGFIRAIIHAESAFNPLAQSRKGAMGLMQLMPGTARDMGVADTTNPEQNIRGGVRYLASLLQTFRGDETLAAAAYNAGPGAVTRHGGVPPFEETQTYVKRVKILADRYKNQKQLATN